MKKEMINLDEAVINALNLFENNLPNLNLGNYKRPLVVGSGNAAVSGRIIFNDKDAVFADESNYEQILKNYKIDGAILISASGGKHSPVIAKRLKNLKIETRMLTCNPNSSARDFVDSDKFFVFPNNPEPYTYNTSTYLGMIIAKTRENPKDIKNYLKVLSRKIPKNLKKYDSYYFIVPNEFECFREMVLTKFDELFQPKISGRCFTPDQSKHAKSIAPNDKELFVSFGYDNKIFGKNRLNIPLPQNSDFGMLLSVSYYFIGQIQRQNPPWFKDNIEEYCKKASKIFGEKILPFG